MNEINRNDKNIPNDIFSEGLIVFKDDVPPAAEEEPVGEFFSASGAGPFSEKEADPFDGVEFVTSEPPFEMEALSEEPSFAETAAAEKSSNEEVLNKELPDEVLLTEELSGEIFPDEVLPIEALPKEDLPDEALPKEDLTDEVLPKEEFSGEIHLDEELTNEILLNKELPAGDDVPEAEIKAEEPKVVASEEETATEAPETIRKDKKILAFTDAEINRQMDLEDLFAMPKGEEPAPEELSPRKRTLAFYNQNADSYYERTISSNMEEQYRFFLKYLSAGARILDLGCGSGRDTKYFRDHGYNVVAIDGSEEMCRRAESYTGINVRQIDFLDLNDREIYAGIWASASLLHIEKKDLNRMFAKLRKALTKDGVLYVSFKEGTFEGFRDGRYYTDLTEGELFNLINTIGGMKIVTTKHFTEQRDDQEVHWLCAIIKKW